MKTSAKSRALCACGLLAVCFTGFSFRLVDLQVGQHAEYAAIAAAKHTDTHKIPARRGSIFDVRGEPLAQNEPLRNVVADASLISDVEALIPILSGPLGIDAATLRQKLTKTVFLKSKSTRVPDQYIPLKRRVPEATASAIAAAMKQQKMRGINFEHDSDRVYPNERMLAHVVGYVNGDDRGVAGIEQSCDSFLRGQDGFRFIERDGTGRELVQYRGQERAARNGRNVTLTVDMGLQNIVESELDAACKRYRPKGATVVMMDPKTGRILALANRPTFSPGDLKKLPAETDKKRTPAAILDERRNRAIADLYEPGSTFKIVTYGAALNDGVVSSSTWLYCENGYWSAYNLSDHAAYRDLDAHSAFVKSSNIAMAKLAMRVGEQKYHEYVRRFGFGEPTGINLPAEEKGVVHAPASWDKLTQSRMAMGHSLQVTPLQIATAISAIANGGKLMMPQIIHEVSGEDGGPPTTYPPQIVRQVISEKSARAVREAMIDVLGPKGTAPNARVLGYKVAGKTGTAQKTEVVDGKRRYSHDKYVVSFAGFMPATDPAFVMVVVIDEARIKQSENYGGIVAGPIFSAIGERAARYLGLPATETRPQGEKAGVLIAKKESTNGR
jgi:cell division protein FtsI (penicillin-binding protein 3)/stage V sporulation protein D (sporulation-specific penicillin-binding protein)